MPAARIMYTIELRQQKGLTMPKKKKKTTTGVGKTSRENKGAEYEKLVESEFSGLLKLEGEHFRNLKIERNIRLDAITRKQDGTAIKRQIDVYWEFELGGVTYRTVIQAKNWNQAIDFPVIDTFKNVLSDLPGQPKGIIVTRVGCGSGEALEYAKAHGISIYLLNEADSELWDGTIPTIDAKINILIVRTNLVQLFTEPSLGHEALARWRESVSGPIDEINIFDEQGNHAGTAEQLRAACIELNQLSPGTQELFAVINVPLFVAGQGSERFKLEGIKVNIENSVLVPERRIYLTVTHVLQLATGEATYTVDNKFKVQKLGAPLTEIVFEQTGPNLKTLDQLFLEGRQPSNPERS